MASPPAITLTGIFDNFDAFIAALEAAHKRGAAPSAVYSPMPLEGYDELLPRRSIIATFVAVGALLSGCALAFWLCVDAGRILAMAHNSQALQPHLAGSIVNFEFLILTAALLAIAAVVWVISTPPRVLPTDKCPGLTEDQYAFSVACAEGQREAWAEAFRAAGAAEIRDE